MLIDAIKAGLAAVCIFAGIAAAALCAAFTARAFILDIIERARRTPTGTKAAAVFFAAIALLYAGTKPVRDAGADEGIALVEVAVEYDETNDVTTVNVRFTGGGVTTTTPVSVRNDETENWRELVKIGATITTDFTTNLLSFAVAGNVSTNRFWWVGNDTPAVIIETKGIEIVHFAASSTSVQIAWTCDDPNATEYTIQRRRKGAAQWETVGVTSSLAFVYVGFTVGETWEWRVSSTYAEDEQ